MKKYTSTQVYFAMQKLPISVRLTLMSSVFLLVLFFSYNIIQYIVINGWMYRQEVNRVFQTSNEIRAYFKDAEMVPVVEELKESKDFLATLNRKNQMIRIIDEKGNVLFQNANQIAVGVTTPRNVSKLEIGDLHHNSDHFLVVRNPVSLPYFKGTVEVTRNLKDFDELNRLILYYLLLAGAGAVIMSGIGGYIISRQVVRPIKLMTETMRQIRNKRDEGLALRVYYFQNRDEFTELASIFNEMMERLEYSFQQQKQFVEDASHELRTPIAIIEGHLSLLNRWGKTDPNVLDESLHLALEETKRLKSIVMELLELSRAEKQTTIQDAPPIQPVPIIEKVCLNMSILRPEFTIRKDLDQLENQMICIKPNHLEQILLIILDNAIKYSGPTKKIDLLGETRDNQLAIIVKDYGQGIAKRDLPFIFQRFYRANKARNRDISGIGLGLSIAHRLVTNYQGSIQAESNEGKGTSMTISFPRCTQPNGKS